MNNRIIFETENKAYRIVEIPDCDVDLDNLKGDTYNPKVNTDIDSIELKRQEREFEDLVSREGVFGYALERWNPEPGIGYEHVDSCFGFVGSYSPSDRSGLFNHYIVDELKSQIGGLNETR